MKLPVTIILFSLLIGLSALFADDCRASGTARPSISIDKQVCLATPGAPVATAWSPDGSFLAAASDYGGVLTVWDKSGKVTSQINRETGLALDGYLDFIDGSSALLFPPMDNAADDEALSVWSVKSGRVIAAIEGPQPGNNSGFNRAEAFQTSADQRTLALSTRGTRGPNVVIYHSGKSNSEIYTAERGATSLSLFDSGRLAAVGSYTGRVYVIDVAQRTVAEPYQTYPESQLGNFSIEAVAGSPDGKLILAGLGAGMLSGPGANFQQGNVWANNMPAIWLLRANDGKLLRSFSGPSKPIRRAAWDPTGRFVAFLDDTGNLFLWQPAASGSRLERVHVGGDSLALAISPDGSRIAVAADCGVQLFAIKISN